MWGSPTATPPVLRIIDSALLSANFWLLVGKTQRRAVLSGDKSSCSEEGGEHTAECFLDRCVFHLKKKKKVGFGSGFGSGESILKRIILM